MRVSSPDFKVIYRVSSLPSGLHDDQGPTISFCRAGVATNSVGANDLNAIAASIETEQTSIGGSLSTTECLVFPVDDDCIVGRSCQCPVRYAVCVYPRSERVLSVGE